MSVNYVTVKIEEGILRGEKLESIRGGSYCSFKGIPYGKPPIGDLRFKSPVPAEPWTGTRDAFKHGHVAPARNMLTFAYEEDSNEDCLYLNVYTPSIPRSKNDKAKSILVWIHGGGLAYGSGNSDLYGPDLLMTEDVVLVTINYRLGPLGFLSLGTTDCPGNFGLKDCVLALKWIQRNISSFGGDPKSVTIFGESAGGSAVQFLLLSKSARGLFHKAISQSGTSLEQWLVVKDSRDYAFALGEKLGLKTKDDLELLEFLKKTPAKDLVLAEPDICKMVTPDEKICEICFLPVAEPDHEDAFITKPPEKIFLDGEVNDVPYILGNCSKESILLYSQNKDYVKSTANEELEKFIPRNLNIQKGTVQAEKFAEIIRNYYFSNGLTQEKLIELYSRIWSTYGIVKTCELLSQTSNRKSPIYVYQFSFDGKKNFFKSLFKVVEFKGATHGDEIGYLFHGTIMPVGDALNPETPEYLTIERMTKLWTDFAKTGNPTPKDNLWKPISGKNLVCLDIGDELILKENFEEEANNVWHEIYDLA